MPTPRLSLEALVDLVLKSGKIDDTKLVRQIESTLRKTKLPPLSIRPQFDIEGKDFEKALKRTDILRSLDEQIAGVRERGSRIGTELRNAVIAQLPKGVELGKGKEGTAIEKRLDQTIRATHAQLQAQEQILSLAHDSERALQSFVNSKTGKQLPQNLELIKQLQRGQLTRASLGDDQVRAVRETAAFLEQRASHLNEIVKKAGKLGQEIRGIEESVTDVGTGREVEGAQRARGLPLHLPDLAVQATDLKKAARDANLALDTTKAARYERQIEGITTKLGDATKGFRAFTNGLKTFEGTDIFQPLRSEMDGVKSGIDDIRKEFRKAQKIQEFGPRAERINELYRELEKRERGIADVRNKLDDATTRRRELALGQYLKNFREISRTTTAQAQAEEGRRLLKGARTPTTLVPKITNVEEGRAVMRALQSEIISTTDKMEKYSASARAAGQETSASFDRAGRKLVQLEQLHESAAQKTRELFRAGTSEGQQAAARQERTLGVDYRKQLGQLDDVNTKLGDVAKRLQDPKLKQVDLSQPTSEMERLSKRAGELRSSLGSIVGTEDLVRRGELSKAMGDELGLLGKEVNRFSKATRKQVTDSLAGLDQAARARQVAAGEQVIRELGGTRPDFTQERDVGRMSDAVAALEDRHKRATEALKSYNSELERGVATDESRRQVLQNTVATQQTLLTNARDALKTLTTEPTQKGVDALTKSIGTIGSSTQDSFGKAQKGLDAFRDELTKLGKRDDFEQLRSQADKYQERLKQLRQQQASLSTEPTRQVEEQAKDLQNAARRLQDSISDLREIPKETARADVERRLDEIARGREDQLARTAAERRGASEVERVRREAQRGALPAGIAPVVLTAQTTALERQLDVMQHIRAESDRLNSYEEQRLATARKLGGEQGELKAIERIRRQRLALAEAEQTLIGRGEVQFPPREVQRAPLTDAQVEAARRAYGINVRDLEQMRSGLKDLQRDYEGRIDDILRKRGALERQLGDSGARANAEYQKLGQKLPIIQRDLGLVRRESERLTKASDALAQLTTPEAIRRTLLTRSIEGLRIVDQAGGPAALARSLRGIRGEDRARLPLVHETLTQQLGFTQARLDTLAAQPGGRTTQEFKQASVEAKNLQSAISRVNGELRGYTKLTTQLGGLARQFVRYGIGYAALYQVLGGVRQLISGITDLDSALVSIQAVTQTTDSQMRIIEGSIKRVAVQTRFTTREIAAAGQVLAQAGVLPQDFPEALSATAQFAAATESSMEISADLLSTMRNVFTELSDLDIANQLTRAVNISKLTAADLKTILSLSAQTARGYNLTSEQYLAAVTTLRNAGIKASTVATGLRQALIEVFAPDSKSLKILSERYNQLGETRSAADIQQRFFQFSQADNPALAVLRELRRLGFTGSGRATFAGRTFDVRAENVIKALITRLDEFTRAESQVSFGNAAVEASKQQLEAINASFANLGAALIATSHSLTEELLPSLENMIDGVTDVVQSIGEFDAKLKATAGTGALTAAGSGGLSLALAALTTPTNLGFVRATGRNLAAAGVGTVASGYAQGLAGEAGLGETASKVLGDIAAVLSTLILFVGNPLKKLGNLLRGVPSAMKLATEGGFTLSKFAGAISALFAGGGILGALKRVVSGAGRLLSFTGPGKVIGLLLGAFTLFERYANSGGFKEAEKKLRQAEKNAVNSTAVVKELESQLKQLQGTGGGYTAGKETIAGQAERLRDSYDDAQANLLDFFDLAQGDLTRAVEIIRELERTGSEEGSPSRIALLQELQKFTSQDLRGDYKARTLLEDLQSQVAASDREAEGLLQGMQENYKNFVEKREELANTLTGETYRRLEEVAIDKNLIGVLDGTLEGSTDQILSLLEAWIQAAIGVGDDVEEIAKARRKQLEDERNRQQKKAEAVLQANTPEQAARVATEGVEVPTTQAEYNKIYGDVRALRELEGPVRADLRRDFERANSTSANPRTRRNAARDVEAGRGQLGIIQAGIDALQARLDAAVGQSERLLEARRAEVTAQLRDLQLLQSERGKSESVNTALRLRERAPSSGPALATVNEALKKTGGNAVEAAKLLVRPERKEGKLTKINVDPAVEAVLGQMRDLLTNYEGELAKQDPSQLTYLQSEEARLRAKQISQLDLEIKKRQQNKKFGELDDLLAERKKLQIAQIDGEIAFEKARTTGTQPEARARQRKLDQLEQQRLDIEFQYGVDINNANREEVELRRQQLTAQLRNLKILTENALNTTGPVDYEKIEQYGQRYAAAMDKLIAATYEYARITGLSAEETKDAVEGVVNGALSIRELIAQYGNVIQTSQNYVRALSQLTAPAATTRSTDLNQEIVRRQRGIPVPADVRVQRAQAVLPELRRELDRRRNNRDRNVELYAQLLAEGRPQQELNAALSNIAQAEAGVQELIDRIVELRKEVQAASLNMGDALRDAFDPEAIFGEFRRRAEESLYNLGNDIRGILGDTFDGVASDFADALFGDLDKDKSFADQLKDTLTQGVKDAGKTAVEAYFKSGVINIAELVAPGSTKPDENGNINPLLKLLGIGGEQQNAYETIEIQGKTVIVSGLVANQPTTGNPASPNFVGPQLPATDARSPFFVGPPSPYNPASPGFVGPPAPTHTVTPSQSEFVGPPAPPGLGENADQAKAEAEAETAGFFTTIKDGFLGAAGAIGAGFSALGGSIAKLFGGGETGRYLSGAFNFFAKDGAVVKAKDGAVLKAGMGVARIRRSMHLGDGGLLKGPGTATSDSIPGVVVDQRGKVVSGLAVSDGEAILNAKAVSALGEDTINFLNKNAARFATGGIVTSSPQLQMATASVSASSAKSRPAKQPSVDLDSLAEVINDSQSGRSPQSLRLEVSEGALNRTLRDYVERHFADVIARR